MLFDAHTHLNYEKYSDEERKQIAEEIEASDLAYIIDASDSVAASRQALRNAEDYSWCYATVGLHPSQASYYNDADLEEIKKLATHPKAVAIGEIGLDFYYGKDNQAEQQELFRKQIRIANKLKMPIVVHSRDAHKLTMDILTEEGAFSEERKSGFEKRPSPSGDVGDARVQMHCFSGSAELAEEYIKLGATISLGGPVTFKNGKRAVEVVRRIPVEFLLSETDAPYMAPEPLRGRPNKPQYVEHIVRRMAIIKGIEYTEAARILTENGCRFFNIKR
ncbi:MAG TPA: TatD family hydrolase [Mogibacterium sp.]|nr:TatD family hydrolase [Mogibacterium sp.]